MAPRGNLRRIINFIDHYFFRYIINAAYPQYYRPRYGYTPYYRVFLNFFIAQKILRINGKVPWPVDYRSKLLGWENIKKGIICDPGDNPGTYINASGGLQIGNNVEFGPNLVIATTNHDKYDTRETFGPAGVTIGSNVWIGAGCIILPGSVIGDEVTIGAGCVITGEIPYRSTVTSDRNNLIIRPKTKPYRWDVSKEPLNRPYPPKRNR